MKLLYLVLILPTFCFSQSPVELYNQNIDAAEMAITKNDFKKATEYYEKAFQINKSPFNSDLYNASVCWLKMGSWQNSKPYLMSLAKRGVVIKELNERAFSIIEKNSDWKQFSFVYNQISEAEQENKIEVIQFEDEDSKINELNKEQKELYKSAISSFSKIPEDSITRIDFRKFSSTLDSVKTTKIKRGLDSLVNQKLNKLINYLKQEGWPNEESIKNAGIEYTENPFYGLVLNTLNPFQSRFFSVLDSPTSASKIPQKGENITIESTPRLLKDTKALFSAVINEAIEAGKIPSIAALILESPQYLHRLHLYNIVLIHIEKSEECPSNYDKYNGKFMQYPRKDAMDPIKYNIIQNHYGIDSQENLSKKYLYNISQNQDFIFPFNRHHEESDFSSCFTLEEFLKTAKIIE